MSLNVGIDFGTSNSGVAVSDGARVRILPLDPTNINPEVVKTILYLTRDGQTTIGQEAVELYYRQNVGRLRRYVKEWIGEVEYRGADMFYVADVYDYVDELMPGRLFQFLKTALRTDGYEGTKVFGRHYKVEELIALYLGTLKQRAEEMLDEEVKGVTLGRPVHFSKDPAKDHKSMETLRQAALNAGFESVDFELEPVAAALFYEQSLSRPETVLIFDFGGGTLDITIMRLGDPQNRTVYANGGIDVAGSDFDRAIIRRRMLPHFGKGLVDERLEILELVNAVSDWMTLPELSVPKIRYRLAQAIQDGLAPARLKALETLIFHDLAFSFYRAVEEAKINLSSQGATAISLENEGIDLWELYTRSQFEKDIREFARQIEDALLDTLSAANLDPAQIDAVVKTGGSSYIPLFSRLLEGIFGAEKVKTSDAFSSVAAGLGIKAGLMDAGT
jgi:hypothetical chaperone protein